MATVFESLEAALDQAEQDPEIDRAEAHARIDQLRAALLKAQYAQLKQARKSLLVVIAGIDGAGKGACISLMNEWLDARHISTLAFGEPNVIDAQRPPLWRYWQHLPIKGRSGIVFGSWYRELFAEAGRKKPDDDRVRALAATVREFESTLVNNGVQIIKLWFHLSKQAQQTRTQTLLANPDTAWQVHPADLKVAKKFGRARRAGLDVMSQTHNTHSPWLVIPSADDNLRALHTGQAVLRALRKRPADTATIMDPDSLELQPDPSIAPVTLEGLDYSAGLKKSEYEPQLLHWQGRLARLVRHKKFAKLPLTLVFEGQDAAGKGGAIRRITHALDARQFRAIPISAPTDEELARPYLWRFWRRLPQPGRIAIFDRSWYGRVLVERIEGYAQAHEWQRAYTEINQFEKQLVDSGGLVLKFWLAITKEEQLQRFRDRQKSPFKAFKITHEDWRNRKHWNDYVVAANDMFARTSTEHCPWTVISANDKHHARIAVLQTVVQALEQRLGVKA
jgi:polyphosphate:AMP phosphotransferase